MGNFFFFPCGWKIALYHYVLWLLVSPPPQIFPIRGRLGQSKISPEPGQGDCTHSARMVLRGL